MPDAFLDTASNPQSVDLRTLAHLLPLELRNDVLAAVSLSLSVSTQFAFRFRKPNLTQTRGYGLSVPLALALRFWCVASLRQTPH
jgi:hypothetical protein